MIPCWLTMSALLILAGPPTGAAVEQTKLRLAESLPIGFHETHHVQGIARSERYWYVTSVDRDDKSGWLFALDASNLSLARSLRLVLGEQYHPGGVQLSAGKLYVPLAEYRPKSTSTILVIDAESLRVVCTIAVDDHIGGAACDDLGRLFLANWDCRDFHIVNADGSLAEKRPSPTGVAYQDVEWHDGSLWAAGNLRGLLTSTSVVDVIDVETWTLRQRYTLDGSRRTGGADFAHEGFTKLGAELWFLPEDGPNSTLYRFMLP